MPVNSFSVGKDVAFDVIINGVPQVFRRVTGFEAKPRYAERESHGLDGQNRHLPIPAGWEGSFEIDRADNAADAFVALTEAVYYAGGGIQPGTIVETITNPDGSLSQYQFQLVTLMLREGGQWKGDDKVMMRFDFRATQRVQIV